MSYAFGRTDRIGALPDRERVRLRNPDEPQVKVLLGGPTLDESAVSMNGSLFVVEADDIEAARRFVEKTRINWRRSTPRRKCARGTGASGDPKPRIDLAQGVALSRPRRSRARQCTHPRFAILLVTHQQGSSWNWMVLNAAYRMDTVRNKVAANEIAMIKVPTPNNCVKVVDWAMPAFGAMGLSQTTELTGSRN